MDLVYKYSFLLIANLVVFASVIRFKNEGFIALNLRRFLKFYQPSWKRAVIMGLSLPIVLAGTLWSIWTMMLLNEHFMFFLYVFSTAVLTWEFITRFEIMEQHHFRPIPALGLLTWLRVNWQTIAWIGLLVGIITVVSTSWWLFPSWVTFDMVALLAAYTIVSLIGQMRVRYLFALLLPIIVYDVWGVFITGMIVEVAQGVSFFIPGLVYIPATPFNPLAPVIGGLGVGDIYCAGLVVTTASLHRLTKYAVWGLAIALALTIIISLSTQQALPATLFLNPIMLTALLVGSIMERRRLVW